MPKSSSGLPSMPGYVYLLFLILFILLIGYLYIKQRQPGLANQGTPPISLADTIVTMYRNTTNTYFFIGMLILLLIIILSSIFPNSITQFFNNLSKEVRPEDVFKPLDQAQTKNANTTLLVIVFMLNII